MNAQDHGTLPPLAALSFVRLSSPPEFAPYAATYAGARAEANAHAPELLAWARRARPAELLDLVQLAAGTASRGAAVHSRPPQQGMSERVLQLLCVLAAAGARSVDPGTFAAMAAHGRLELPQGSEAPAPHQAGGP